MLIHETTEFRDAFFAHSEALDAPPERQAPKYIEGSSLLKFMLSLRDFEEDQDDRHGYEVFHYLRGNLISSLAVHLRIVGQAKQRKREIPQTLGRFTAEESAAAYLLLNFASEELQDKFLRGERDFQDALIYAVLKDGGLYDPRGFWCELVLP